jgi:putative lipoic acid-binding regulatory protein
MRQDPEPDRKAVNESSAQAEPADKPQIDYPTVWSYTLFGTSEDPVRTALQRVLGDRDHSFAASNTSKGGKYCSFQMSLAVYDEDDRLNLGEQLAAQSEILFVL